MNECRVDNVDLLLFIMKPVKPILKQFTVVVFSVMSVAKRDVPFVTDITAFFTKLLVEI